MRFWIIYILIQISFYKRLLQSVLAKFFFVGQLWWSRFLLSHPSPPFYHKNASYGLAYKIQTRNKVLIFEYISFQCDANQYFTCCKLLMKLWHRNHIIVDKWFILFTIYFAIATMLLFFEHKIYCENCWTEYSVKVTFRYEHILKPTINHFQLDHHNLYFACTII